MQSKKHSLLETGSNLVIGYIVAVVSQMFFYHYYEIQISLGDNMMICIWMTFVSILRSYTLRRWWNRKTVREQNRNVRGRVMPCVTFQGSHVNSDELAELVKRTTGIFIDEAHTFEKEDFDKLLRPYQKELLNKIERR